MYMYRHIHIYIYIILHHIILYSSIACGLTDLNTSTFESLKKIFVALQDLFLSIPVLEDHQTKVKGYKVSLKMCLIKSCVI